MSIENTFGNYFKTEIRSSGQKLVQQNKISIPNASDTEVHAYVKVAPPVLVHFSSEDISSETVTVECSCPAGQKSQFCKHVWATLLCVEEKYPDFLSSKTSIEKGNSLVVKEALGQVAAKARASEMRKQQYEKQKARMKEFKLKRHESESAFNLSVLPATVQTALEYFSNNGFPMPKGPSELVVSDAKRKLSRVFHPDKGGSNGEMQELNRNCEEVLNYLLG